MASGLRRGAGVALMIGGIVAGLSGLGMAAGSGVAEAAPVALNYSWQAPGATTTPGQKVMALTFDDGPDPTWTPQIMSVLEQYHVPATFFEIGEEVAAHPANTAAVAAAGFPVEDHTYSHPDLNLLSAAAVGAQIDQTQQRIQSITGTAPTCVRPPYNDWDTAVLDEIDQRGLATMSYSVDPRDWARPGVQAIVNDVLSAAKPGAVVDFHDGGGDRSQTVAALPAVITGLEARGYSFVSICGGPPPPPPPPPPVQSQVYSFGTAGPAAPPILSTAPLVGSAVSPDGGGYWFVSATGHVFAQGDAPDYGDVSGLALAQPIVGMAATPDGRGYWLVAADGGIFSFGDATFAGSTGAIHLNQPIVGMAADPATGGYWLLARDGGVFAFDAPFFGSMGGTALNQPTVGMAATADGSGYHLVASDGGIFSFGDATFAGSTGGITLNQPIVGMATDVATGGYWLVASDGGVFCFDAPFDGSRGGVGAASKFFGILPVGGGSGYYLVAQQPT